MVSQADTVATMLQLWIYSSTQTILDLNSKPTATTAPDQLSTDNSGQVANTRFVNTVLNFYLNKLKGNVPAALDTLQKIAAAIGNNSAIYTDFQAKLAKMLSLSSLQQGNLLLATHATVTAGEQLTLSTALTAKVDGMVVRFKPTSTLSGAAPMLITSIAGDAPAPLGRSDGLAYRPGDVAAGSWAMVQWNATGGKWELMNPYSGALVPFSSMTEIVTGATVNKAVSPRDVALALSIMRDGVNLLPTKYTGTIASGIYGRELVYVRLAGVNTDGHDYRPGDTLTVSADLNVDAALLAAGQNATLILYTRNQAGVWTKSGSGQTTNLTATRVSGTLTLPAAADMHDIGIGIYHQGLGIVNTSGSVGVITYDNLQLQWGGVATSYQIGYAGAPTNLDSISEVATALNNLGDAGNKLLAALQLKATLASPVLTGTPQAPTTVSTDNSKSVATTAFTQTVLALAFAANSAVPATTTVQGKYLLATMADAHLTEVITGSVTTVGMSDLDVTLYPLNTWVSAFTRPSIFWGFSSSTLCAVVTISAGTIKVDHTNNCTPAFGAYGDPLDGTAKSIGIIGSLADINLALSTLKVNVGANASAVMTIGATPINTSTAYDPITGYYYSILGNTGATMSWTNAKLQASVPQFNGLGGYLGAVVSADENALVASLITGPAWLGGSDSQVEGTWIWAGGPYAGQPLTWTNWNPGEPSNSGGSENYLEIMPTSGKWNDLGDNSAISFAVVKFGGPGAIPLEQISKKFSLMAPTNAPTDRAVSCGILSKALAAKAMLASPAFLGAPKGPTPAASDNSKSFATTEFVIRALTARAQPATTSTAGTMQPAVAGVAPSAAKALTPEVLSLIVGSWVPAPRSTESVIGLSTFATQQETLIGASDSEFVTPKTAKVAIAAAIANIGSTTVGSAPTVTVPGSVYCLKPFSISMVAIVPAAATSVVSFTLTLQPHAGSAWTATTETLSATNNAASVSKTLSVLQEGGVDVIVVANYNTGTSSKISVTTLTATKVIISAPVITFPIANQTGVTHTPLVTFTPSTLSAGTDTFVSVDCMITHLEGGSVVVDYVKNGDTASQTSLQIPDGVLASGNLYTLTLRSNYAVYGEGLWGSVSFSVASAGTHSLIQIIETPTPILNGQFGLSVDMSYSGAVLVIGTKAEGKAYVYEWNTASSSYALAATLTNSGADAGEYLFGTSVQVSEDGALIVVGCPAASLTAATTSGKRGYFFTYKKTNGAWTNSHKVTHQASADTPVTAMKQFAMALSVSGNGNTLAVGSNYNSLAFFQYNSATDTWGQAGMPVDYAGAGGDYGLSLFMSRAGDRCAVGAASASVSGIGATVGLCDIWVNTSGVWTIESSPKPPQGLMVGSYFGSSLHGNANLTKLLIGSPGSVAAATVAHPGAIYLFSRDQSGSTWTTSSSYVQGTPTVDFGLGRAVGSNENFDSLVVGCDWSADYGSANAPRTGNYGNVTFLSTVAGALQLTETMASPIQAAYYDGFGAKLVCSGDGRRAAIGMPGWLGSLATQGRVYIYNV
jgi:hypothetical protein